MKKALLLLCYLSLYGYGIAQKTPVVKLIKDIPANRDYPLENFTEFNGEVYFTTYSTDAGIELWKTDGTEEGTRIVKDIYEGTSNSNIAELTVFNNKLYFVATDATYGREIWQTDGTEACTTVLKDVNPATSARNNQIGSLVVIGSTMYFHANDGTHGDELWKTDGTTAGTVMVKDVNEGPVGSCPALLTNKNGTIYFIANPTNTEYGQSGGRELWKTDGTEAGTVRVKDFGVRNGQIQELIAFNGEVYFGAEDGVNGKELWKTDGTEAGTKMVRNINVAVDYNGIGYDSNPSFITVFDNELYFNAYDGRYTQIYKTDGTTDGTKKLSDGYSRSSTTKFIQFNDNLYIGRNSSLWKIAKGGASATQLKSTFYNPSSFHIFNNELYFSTSRGIWKSDGTSNGTTQLKASGYNSNPKMIEYDSLIHFQASDYSYGTEVWSTDGTVAGTKRVTDLWPGRSGNTMPIMAYKDIILLTGNNGNSQCDLWQFYYNHLPTSDSTTINATEDVVYQFNKGNFSFSDEDKQDSLTAVHILSVSEKGFLFYDKNNNQRLDHADVMIEDSTELVVEEVNKLAFIADENKFGQNYAFFTFKVKDLHQYSDSTYTATIHVSPVADLPKITYANTEYGKVNAEGLVVTRSELDGEEVNSVEIVEINNGRLFRNDLELEFEEGDIISFVSANTGLNFLADSAGFGSVGVRAAVSRTGDGLSLEAINYVWVDKADQEISINEISYWSYSNDTIELDAEATSGLEVSLVANGPGKIEENSLIINGEGMISLVASQNGNRNYYPAAPLVQHIERVTVSDTIHTKEHILVSDTIFQTNQILVNDTLYLTKVVHQIDTISTLVSAVDSVFTTISKIDTLNQTVVLLDTVYTEMVSLDTLYNIVEVADTLSRQPIVISLQAPLSMRVGDAVELTAERSVTWPVTYSVEGPGTINGKVLTALDTGKITVSATQLTADSSQSLVTVREEIEVKADIIASLGSSLNESGEVLAFPNPTSGIVKLRINAPDWRKAQVIIQNALGQQVAHTQLHAHQMDIDLSAYQPGMYLLIIRNGKQQQVMRISKK
ncbi:MAG: ELWxxDGT repeat protein [Cyclobacteriaceae bacterium]